MLPLREKLGNGSLKCSVRVCNVKSDTVYNIIGCGGPHWGHNIFNDLGYSRAIREGHEDLE